MLHLFLPRFLELEPQLGVSPLDLLQLLLALLRLVDFQQLEVLVVLPELRVRQQLRRVHAHLERFLQNAKACDPLRIRGNPSSERRRTR